MASSDFSTRIGCDFASSAYTQPDGQTNHRRVETSPVSSSTLLASRSPYAGGFFAVVCSGASPLPWPSLCMRSSAPS